MVDSNFWKI